MNEVMDALVNRRSVRKYKAEAVPEELVKEILKKAGLEGEYLGIGNLVIGYADQQPKAAPRKAGRAFFIK